MDIFNAFLADNTHNALFDDCQVSGRCSASAMGVLTRALEWDGIASPACALEAPAVCTCISNFSLVSSSFSFTSIRQILEALKRYARGS